MTVSERRNDFLEAVIDMGENTEKLAREEAYADVLDIYNNYMIDVFANCKICELPLMLAASEHLCEMIKKELPEAVPEKSKEIETIYKNTKDLYVLMDEFTNTKNHLSEGLSFKYFEVAPTKVEIIDEIFIKRLLLVSKELKNYFYEAEKL